MRDALSIAAVFAKVEATLASGSLAKDERVAAKVLLALASRLPRLDPEQCEGLRAAEARWSDTEDGRARDLVTEKLDARVDADLKAGRDCEAVASATRIVWASLTTSGLSAITGEFYVGLAENAGLTAAEIDDAFAQSVPGYRGSEGS